MQDNSVKSAYIHVPFCRKICSYCDFCKNFYNPIIVRKYLDSLKREIKDNYKGEKLETIYIGGGTPSCLDTNLLIELFDVIKVLKLEDNYEFTFECNYEDINKTLLETLKNGGVNRLSIGIQTFNKRFSKFLNRNVNKDKMISKIKLAKCFFDNINLDLMYALPFQNIKELNTDIDTFLKMNVNHLSIYALIVEKHTKLYIDKFKEVPDEMQAKMYSLIIKKLKKRGYNHYEISNFSKEGKESKHNLAYWNNNRYYGFGVGASGFINNVRYDNTKSVPNYIKGKRRIYEETLDKAQLIKDEVMLNLRKTSGINKSLFKEKYGINFNDVFDIGFLKENKFLIETDALVYISEKNLFVSNEIISLTIESSSLN